MIFIAKNINKYGIKKFSTLPCEVGKLPRYIPNNKINWKSTAILRSHFIDYFLKNNHKYIEPCDLNSKNIGSYFVNSGVSQFRDRILGHNSTFSNVNKAVNSQRCVRLGGKSCDLSNIGYDSSHLSYFEMLGNWSFGSYGKNEACKLMWRFLTEELELPSSHLYVTYFGGSDRLGLPPDHETRDLWFSLGIKGTKVLPFGEEHNFWEMGDRSLNPLCGPSSEIHWDYLATLADSNDPRCARCFVNSSSSEVVELWNCVFMEYKWTDGGTKLTKLPALIIDTGMGLERLSSIMQGVCGVFDTDSFKDIIDHLSDVSECSPYQGTFALNNESPVSKRLQNTSEETKNLDSHLRKDIAYRVISDHLRALCVCVSDGIQPGRQNTSLKVRQLLQRAIRQSSVGLGMSGGLSKLVDTVCQSFSDWQKVDGILREKVKNIIDKEEKIFLPKLHSYEALFENFVNQRDLKNKEISEEELRSLLHGKFGQTISLDMVRAMCQDAGLRINESFLCDSSAIDTETHVAMNVPTTDMLHNQSIPLPDNSSVYNYTFNNKLKVYEVADLETSVTGFILNTSLDNKAYIEDSSINNKTSEFGLLTERTNMFATKGGQDCDKGFILWGPKKEVVAVVNEVTQSDSGHIIHWCSLIDPSALIGVSDELLLRVDQEQRTGTTLHHTAHHIVFSVLNELLGRINQESSSVKCDHAKFGFSLDVIHGDIDSLLDIGLAEKLERRCCDIIQTQLTVERKEKVLFSQISQNNSIRYLKSENLPSEVQQVLIGDTSEVCCGTHAQNTGHLQDIIITSLKRTNQAISEISFITGKGAVEVRKQDKELLSLCSQIERITFDTRGQLGNIIKTLNRALCCNVMSKTTRAMVTESVNKALKLKIEAPSISEVLKQRLLSDQTNSDGIRTYKIHITSIKKAILTILELKVSSPVILYDSKKMLIYSKQNDLGGMVRECVRSTDHSIADFIIESPKVRNMDSGSLSPFISVTLPELFRDHYGLVTDLKNCIEKQLSGSKNGGGG